VLLRGKVTKVEWINPHAWVHVNVVGADGKVSEVTVSGKATAGAVTAIQRFIASCTYAPALREGKPVAVRWRGELDFTRR